MTTDTRRRPAHPAAGSRRAVAGLATALGFGLVTVMSWPTGAAIAADAIPAQQTTTPVGGAAEPSAPATTATTLPGLRVVVRRHHPVAVEAPPPRVVRAQPATSGAPRAPAPASRPAPRPRTRSGGS